MRYLIFDLHFLARSRSRLQIANRQSPIGFYSLLFHLQMNNTKKRITKKYRSIFFGIFKLFSFYFVCLIFANCFVLLHSHTRDARVHVKSKCKSRVASSCVPLRCVLIALLRAVSVHVAHSTLTETEAAAAAAANSNVPALTQ